MKLIIHYSIIIPTHKENKSFYNCLHAILSQDYPRAHYEVIISANQIAPKFKEKLKQFKEVLVIEANHLKSASHARNQGAKAAKGEFLIFIDSDVVIDHNWISTIHFEIKNNPFIQVATSTIKPNYGTSLLSRYRLERFKKKTEEDGTPRVGDNVQLFLNTAALVIRKKIFSALLFKEDLKRHEDTLLSAQISHSYLPTYATSKTKAIVFFDGNLIDYLIRNFKNGLFFFKLMQLLPTKYVPRTFLKSSQVKQLNDFRNSGWELYFFHIINNFAYQIGFTIGNIFGKKIKIEYKVYKHKFQSKIIIRTNLKKRFRISKNVLIYIKDDKEVWMLKHKERIVFIEKDNQLSLTQLSSSCTSFPIEEKEVFNILVKEEMLIPVSDKE